MEVREQTQNNFIETSRLISKQQYYRVNSMAQRLFTFLQFTCNLLEVLHLASHVLSTFVGPLTSWPVIINVFPLMLTVVLRDFQPTVAYMLYNIPPQGPTPSTLNGCSSTTFCTHHNLMSLMLSLNNKRQPAAFSCFLSWFLQRLTCIHV